MYKLSIITINYNNLVGLKKTVDSIISQTWKDFEYIVIDGGSSDGSASYIERQSENIDYWVSEYDKGIYNAMNKGISQAHGKYLLFVNSGDCLYNNEVLFNINEDLNSNISFMCGHLFYQENNQKNIREHPVEMSFSYLVSKTVSHPSTFIKKTMFDKYGLYNEENKIISDWEFFFKAMGLNGESYKKLYFIITNFDIGGISSSNFDLVFAEKEMVYKRYLPYVFNNENDSYIFDKFRERNKRFKYLKVIDSNPFFRKIATLQLALTAFAISLVVKK